MANTALYHAVDRAYRALLPRGRSPVGILRLTLPPTHVDCNAHPAKAEVRLRDERAVADQLTAAIEEALSRRLASPAWPRNAVLGLANGQATFGGDFGVAEAPAPYQEPPPPDLRALRPLGQIDNAFIVAVAPDGLYLVDQHRAHERILYDELQAAGERIVQPPLLVEEPADRHDAFYCEATPHDAMATAACKSALKAGRALDPGEQAELLRRLAETAVPTTCPHGSPTIIRFDSQFVRRQFGRR
ncbi:MAG: hypothetical protein NZ518_03905 [Dehalococcoidia bacterium]|nr:hypothetical protein [Dehalococcoidia bacterium]